MNIHQHPTNNSVLQHGVLPELHADPGTTAKVYERTRTVRRQAL